MGEREKGASDGGERVIVMGDLVSKWVFHGLSGGRRG